ncbi:CPBP family intramembrane glutamic endopeptidase [Candidatus Zixiibacteriota bacterium]
MNLTIPPIHTEAIAAVLLFVISYATYHFDLLARLFIQPFVKRVPGEKRQAYSLFLRRISGAFILGLIPLTVLSLIFDRDPGEYGFQLPTEPLWLVPTLAACTIIFFVLLNWIRKPASAESFPFARLSEWHCSERAVNALSWITYLAAYESALRGYLFFSLMRSIGAGPAILLVTAIYVSIHLGRPRKEVLGAAFGGPAFCIVALASGSILIPWLIHAFIAVGIDTLAIRFHYRVIRIRNREADS